MNNEPRGRDFAKDPVQVLTFPRTAGMNHRFPVFRGVVLATLEP